MNDRIFRQCLLFLGLTAIILLWLGRYTDIDVALADRMYDFSRHEFVWRNQWFAAVFMHESMKIALIAFGLALLALLAVSCTVLPDLLPDDMRRPMYVVLASAVLVPLIISLLKSSSIHACPWALQRYGGTEPYLRIFASMPVNAVAGHCFPAGHASSGLWLAAFAVFWLRTRPRFAAAAFAAGLIPGATLGLVQQMRGAHFLTHTLWSMWIAGLVIAVLARAFYVPGMERSPN